MDISIIRNNFQPKKKKKQRGYNAIIWTNAYDEQI